jgi:propionyl-CoA carboxylase alpha chain
MKMENVLRADRDGTVTRIGATAGEGVVADQVILEIA